MLEWGQGKQIYYLGIDLESILVNMVIFINGFQAESQFKKFEFQQEIGTWLEFIRCNAHFQETIYLPTLLINAYVQFTEIKHYLKWNYLHEVLAQITSNISSFMFICKSASAYCTTMCNVHDLSCFTSLFCANEIREC